MRRAWKRPYGTSIRPCVPANSIPAFSIIAGREEVVRPKTHWARPIDVPPFIGYPLRPGITFTYLGLKVDQNARVMMQDERPSANLFAAGEIMAGNILGEGYIAGIGMAIGAVFC